MEMGEGVRLELMDRRAGRCWWVAAMLARQASSARVGVSFRVGVIG